MNLQKLLLTIAVLLSCVSCRTADEKAAEALACRVMGDKASVVAFEQIDTLADYYELLQDGSERREHAACHNRSGGGMA